MKTLILYATKYGATKEIAEKIGSKMDSAVIYDVKQGNIPPLDEFERIIIGSSLYAGSIRKELKKFVSSNVKTISDKTVGVFLSGMGESESEGAFISNFPAEIIKKAKAKALLGGIFDPQKAGAMARFIMKIVTKQSGYINTINDEKIDRFVQGL